MQKDSVVRNFRTTATDGKNYNVTYYALPMVLAVGFRVKSARGTQFIICRTAKKHEAEAADKDDEEELKALELAEKRILEKGK